MKDSIALYVHFPWCIKKCPYCDFNSHAMKGDVPERAYVDVLIKDLDQLSDAVLARPLSSVFMGGGTPSLFSPESMQRLYEAISDRFSLDQDFEWTMEANPGSFEVERFSDFKAAGINRFSLGAQSFNDSHLRKLGRVHDGDRVRKALTVLNDIGVNFNIDIMMGLVNQTVTEAMDDLCEALDYAPNHLSWYQLTLEPNTLFYHTRPTLPDDEHLWEMTQKGHAKFAERGYEHYEVSAFARKTYRSRHNTHVWHYGDYIGIGAGACGKITSSDGQVVRTTRHRHPTRYMQAKDTVMTKKSVSCNQQVFEYFLGRFRCMEPIALTSVSQAIGYYPSPSDDPFVKALEKGLIQWSDTHIHLTDLGERFLNDLTELFLPTEDA